MTLLSVEYLKERATSVFDNLVANLLAPVVLAIAYVIWRYIMKQFVLPKLGISYRILIFQCSAISVAATLFYFEYKWAIWCIVPFLVLAPFVMLRHFRRIGISNAFSDTSAGINFDASLKSVSRKFAFLGIGADKLTRSPEFEAAMGRCATNGNVARFLLASSDNPSLERMARRNDIDPAVYKNRLKDSLRRLARIQKERGYNIEVRLYSDQDDKDYQRFRLLFVNEEFCILSWTVWGPHEGRENPQIILRSRTNSDRENSSLYKAYSDYYESLWESGQPVNLGGIR